MHPLLCLAAMSLAATQPTPVTAVYPSGGTIPANLLRVSIRFAVPPPGLILPQLSLRGAALSPAQSPFVDQELWSPDGRVLTLLFDPARVKSGLMANQRFGAVLRQGQAVTLTLAGAVIARWRVGAAERTGPRPAAWTIAPAPAGTRRPLLVRFDHPIDALDAGMLAVAGPDGRALAGTSALGAAERAWRFIPTRPWARGYDRLLVSPDLEDAAGNAVAAPFQQPAGAGPVAPPASIGFAVH